MHLDHPAERYVDDVLNGKIVACRWVRLVCERHRRDLETGHKRGLYFDPEPAKLVIVFFQFLRHSQGQWAGQPIALEPWQQAHLWMLFGWMRADGTRRFRTSYFEVARKNGKSTLAAGIGLYMTFLDGESGAQVYTAATKKEQAQIIHQESINMVEQSPDLSNEFVVLKNNLSIPSSFSKYEPISSEAKRLDGLNVHCALVDEVHAWPDRHLWDVLETATGARQQPLMYAITTAGTGRHSYCYELHTYTRQILEGVIEDDSFYGIIYTLDDEKEWENPDAWIKANPNLGISKHIDKLAEEVQKAQNMPTSTNSVKRWHFNIWTDSVTRWLSRDHWDACAGVIDEAQLAGRQCWGGLDLSSRYDVTALVWVFPNDDGGVDVVCRFFIPEETVQERVERDRVKYDVWVEQGWILTTPGNVIDYDFIVEQIKKDDEIFDIQAIGFDPWNSTQTATNLQNEGFEVVKIRQGFSNLSEPMKELGALIKSHKVNHGGNPVLTWMADNLMSKEDAAGNIMPDKKNSTERIDGMVALIMGIDGAVVRNEGEGESIYETRGIVTLGATDEN